MLRDVRRFLGMELQAPTDRLTPKDVARVVKSVERRERYKLGIKPRIVFTERKKSRMDYARWEGEAEGSPNRLRKLTIHVYDGVPRDLQAVELEHEVTEIIGKLKGRSITQAHRRAMHHEKQTLKKLPYRTSSGKPYTETVPLMKRMEKRQAGAMRDRPTTAWQRILRGIWPW